VAGLAYCLPATVQLNSENIAEDLLSSVVYLEDGEEKLDAITINKKFNSYDWQAFPKKTFKLGSGLKTRWLSTTILSPNQAQDWIASVEYFILPVINVWVFDGDEIVSQHNMGSQLPFSQHPIQTSDYAISMHLEANKEYRLIYQVISSGSFDFALTIDTVPHSISSRAQQHLKFGLYYGIAIVMLMYNLLLYSYNREWSYLVYGCIVASLIGTLVTIDGLGFQYLWPNRPEVNYYAVTLASSLAQVFTTVFAILFMGIHRLYKKLYGALIAVIFLDLSSVIGTFVLEGYTSYIWGLVTHQITVPVVLFAGAYMWYRGQVYARLFTLAWIMLSSSTVVMVLIGLSVISWQFDDAMEAYRFTSLAAMALLALGLTKRIQFLAQEEERARLESEGKSQFIAQVSHELRTPMNGVLGMSALLRDHLIEPKAIHYNNVIYQCGLALLGIINDVLDAAKIDADKLETENIPLNLQDLCEQSLCVIEPQAMVKSLVLKLNIDEKIPHSVLGDPNRIRQILLNFLSNAEKFTDSGSITLSAVPVDHNVIRIAVTDTGPGIPTEEQGDLFVPYTQHESNPIKGKGTGLGLFICKKITEIMDGSIGVTSRDGEGATFWIELPLIETADAPIPLMGQVEEIIPFDSETEKPLTILVAEDNATNQMVIEKVVEKMGHSVRIVNNGEEALNVIMDNPDIFDLVLMDCEMPIMNGYTATVKIREYEESNNLKPIPIVALTANAMQEARDKSSHAGMNELITKPIRFLSLQEALHRNTRLQPD